MTGSRRGGRSYMGLCQGSTDCPDSASGDLRSWRAAEAWAKRHAEKYDHEATAESYVRYFPGGGSR
jgi:hypothetical protein